MIKKHMKPVNLIILMLLLFTISGASASTFTVDMHSNNTSYAFSSIQDAINHAQEHDSIIISKGIYTESLTIDKPVGLYSVTLDPKDVILESNDSSSPIIHIRSDDVKIDGITITGQNDTHPTAGILIDNADNLRIQNNVISNTQDGLYIRYSSGNNIQNNSILSNTEHGIYLLDSTLSSLKNNNIHDNKRGFYVDEADQIIIEYNNISNNQMYGMALRESSSSTITENELILNNIGLALTSSDKNTIFGNNLNENKQYGLHLWQSNSNSVKENHFAENEDSGIRLISLSSNNIFEQNTFYNNLNGIIIESTDNNIIKNNKFRSNEEYGIYHRYPDDKNTIEDNSFADNTSENINFSPFQKILIFIITLIVLTIIAFYFGLSWLKKGIAGLIVLAILVLILTIIWYFPFEADMPGNNVYVENLEANATPINETYSRVMISMKLNYLYKDAFSHSDQHGEMTDNLPVFVQIETAKLDDGMNSSGGNMKLVHEEQVVLDYLESNNYEYTLDMKSGNNYKALVEVMLKRELPYPHPSYGEVKWELLGGLRGDIDLR